MDHGCRTAGDRKRAGASRVIRRKLHRNRAARLGADDVSRVERRPCRGHAPRRSRDWAATTRNPQESATDPTQAGRAAARETPAPSAAAIRTIRCSIRRCRGSGRRFRACARARRTSPRGRTNLPRTHCSPAPCASARTGPSAPAGPRAETPSAAAVPKPKCSRSRREPASPSPPTLVSAISTQSHRLRPRLEGNFGTRARAQNNTLGSVAPVLQECGKSMTLQIDLRAPSQGFTAWRSAARQPKKWTGAMARSRFTVLSSLLAIPFAILAWTLPAPSQEAECGALGDRKAGRVAIFEQRSASHALLAARPDQ